MSLFDGIVKIVNWIGKAWRIDEINGSALISDPFAQQIDWEPLVPGATSFKTQRLVRLSPARLEYKMSMSAAILVSVFLLAPVVAVGTYFATRGGGRDLGKEIGIIVFGVLFSAAAVLMLLHMLKPICFDLKVGKFWKNAKDPDAAAAKGGENVCDLVDVYALQIVAERIKQSGSSGRSVQQR